MTEPDRPKQDGNDIPAQSIAISIALGIALGTPIWLVFDNIGLGAAIGVGIALGVAVWAGMGARKNGSAG
jgi:hypothetical protein